MSNSLRPHGLQHTRPPCPSPTPGAYSNSCQSGQWCHSTSHSLSSPSPPAPNPSQHQSLFQWVSSLYQVPKYWSFSFSISPSNEYLGLISFRMDCLDLLAVQGTLKSLLQHHSSKASILQCSAFFIVQIYHLCIAAAARRSSQEEVPNTQGQERQLRGGTPHPGSGAMAERRHPTCKVKKPK